MARPNPAITQRKSDPHSTQIIVLGRVVACRASLVVTSTFFGIAGPTLAWSAHKETRQRLMATGFPHQRVVYSGARQGFYWGMVGFHLLSSAGVVAVALLP